MDNCKFKKNEKYKDIFQMSLTFLYLNTPLIAHLQL